MSLAAGASANTVTLSSVDFDDYEPKDTISYALLSFNGYGVSTRAIFEPLQKLLGKAINSLYFFSSEPQAELSVVQKVWHDIDEISKFFFCITAGDVFELASTRSLCRSSFFLNTSASAIMRAISSLERWQF